MLCISAFGTSPNGVHGRFDTDGYFAIPADADQTLHGPPVGLGTVYDPTHPILDGVASFSGSVGADSAWLPATSSVASGATRIADWDDGFTTPLVAVRTLPGGGRRADLGMVPYSHDVATNGWDPATDGARLMANALLWVAGEI